MGESGKIADLMNTIHICIKSGHYLDSLHATERQNERKITRQEVLFVLQNGYHEKTKDKFDQLYKAWNYAIRGKTLDSKELRVIISFDENLMLIITAIDLKK